MTNDVHGNGLHGKDLPGKLWACALDRVEVHDAVRFADNTQDALLGIFRRGCVGFKHHDILHVYPAIGSLSKPYTGFVEEIFREILS
jgi:hypothetical protein